MIDIKVQKSGGRRKMEAVFFSKTYCGEALKIFILFRIIIIIENNNNNE